jgi:hypothetical protein
VQTLELHSYEAGGSRVQRMHKSHVSCCPQHAYGQIQPCAGQCHVQQQRFIIQRTAIELTQSDAYSQPSALCHVLDVGMADMTAKRAVCACSHLELAKLLKLAALQAGKQMVAHVSREVGSLTQHCQRCRCPPGPVVWTCAALQCCEDIRCSDYTQVQ